MQIQGLQSSSALQSVAGAQRAKPAQTAEASATTQSTPVDQLDLSAEALALSDASQAEATSHQERLNSIKQAIADGSYETPERMSAALDKLLDSFA
jgi:negative regulator of flagellin synthesis FlgM